MTRFVPLALVLVVRCGRTYPAQSCDWHGMHIQTQDGVSATCEAFGA